MSKKFQIVKKILQIFCLHLKAGIFDSAFGMHAIQMWSVAVLPMLPLM
jgi:hypothetical protein